MQMVEPELLSGLLDEANDPLLALDENGGIVHLNAAAASRLGHARQRLVGMPFTSLVDLADRERARTALHEAADGAVELELGIDGEPVPFALRRLPGVEPSITSVGIGSAAYVEPPGLYSDAVVALDRIFTRFPYGVVGLRQDGRVVFANPRALQLLGAHGVQAGRRIPAASPLSDLVERLLGSQAVVHDVPLALGSRRLRALGIGARDSGPAVVVVEDVTDQEHRDTVMREFLRNAAHQLRTPLTGIVAAVEVLQTGAKEIPEERDRFLAHVEAHADRLARLAHGLLVLARAQSGGAMPSNRIELRPMLLALAAEAAPAAGVRISVDCPAELGALAEPDLAREALSALVENAVTHTTEGSIALRASAKGDVVEIEVADTGGGIPAEHRQRIFEPFYRPGVDGEGFGLGLAIASEAAAAMDGELVMDNSGRGAVFTMRLPAGEARP